MISQAAEIIIALGITGIVVMAAAAIWGVKRFMKQRAIEQQAS